MADNINMNKFSEIKLYFLGNQTIVCKILRNAFMTCKVIDFDQKLVFVQFVVDFIKHFLASIPRSFSALSEL